MTRLFTETGEVFAIGSANYYYHPIVGDITNRIILPVAFEDVPVEAIIDTGSPYGVCPPWVARTLNIDPSDAIEQTSFRVRNFTLIGGLHRINIAFLPSDGNPMIVDATVFVPDMTQSDLWGERFAFIGLTGCLERMRFAIDPENQLFYFGLI